MDRARRSGSSRASATQAALDRLRELRSGSGRRRVDQVTLKEETAVYDIVSEDDYEKMVAERREMGDFVEDDDGIGYVDDGEENWEALAEKEKKISKVARDPKKKKSHTPLLPEGRVSNVFLGGGSGRVVAPGMNSMSQVAIDASEAMMLDTLMSTLDEETDGDKKSTGQSLTDVAMFGHSGDVASSMSSLYESRTSGYSTLSRLSTQVKNEYAIAVPKFDLHSLLNDEGVSVGSGRGGQIIESKENPMEQPDWLNDTHDSSDDDDDYVGGTRKSKVKPTSTTTTTTTSTPKESFTQTVGNMPIVTSHKTPVRVKAEPGVMPYRALPPSEGPKVQIGTGMDWTAVKAMKPTPSSPPPSTASTSTPTSTSTSPVNSDGDILFYWFDAYEDPVNSPGNVYLFGKVLMPDGKSTQSCCIIVNNLERNVFVLPRKYKLQNAKDESSVTDAPVTMMDVYTEMNTVLNHMGVTNFKCKSVKRQYCFDRDLPPAGMKSSLVDPQDGVPAETDFLKVVYSAKDKALPRDLTGKTFSRCFGTRSSALELFLLKRDLMGPCWLSIRGVTTNERPLSWCKYEYAVANQKQITVVPSANAMEPPVFSVMSLSFKTILNEKTHKHEIVMASYIIHEQIGIDGPTQNEADVQHLTMISKLARGTTWPFDWVANVNQVNKKAGKNVIVTTESEQALLGLLLSKIHTLDPDMLMGHDLHGFGLEVLLHRMRTCKISFWSKLGRLKKSKMPITDGRGQGTFSLADKGVTCGRLLVDTMVSAKEFIYGQRSYTLTNLAETQLKVNREDIDFAQVPAYYNSTAQLMQLINHNENDAWLCMALMHKLVLIPLTKQLTALAGNLWQRSLRSSRAERVEFLLLHEFHRLKYIVPEKYTSKEREEKNKGKIEHGDEDGDDDGEEKTSKKTTAKRSKNKPQYAGGLVLEPKRGFYDKFVMLLDFNSLYPSIIQEFNICFTTVKHWHHKPHAKQDANVDDDTQPAGIGGIPEAGLPTGRLPKVIQRLVERRRAVKSLMKTETDPGKQRQLNIRQQALKLVANSMYGCLGFVNSRFYCEPLAALITSQGRHILQTSVELVSSMGYNVIYGDTDSIMVYTNESSLDLVYTIARNVKKEINKKFRVLEIDLDGVFKNMLLLRKKKYAALKIVEAPDGTRTAVREMKGLDLVRRDWCQLSKDVGQNVLDEILSGRPREEVVERIHQHLEKVKDDMKNNAIMLDKFIITKGLTKHPKEYPDAKGLPHVQVALQLLAKGKTVRVGDFIPYIICEGDLPMAQRAYHPSVITAAGGALQIDQQWYLSNQVLPPVARLCGPIVETDAARIAHCLGLDPKQFSNFSNPKETAAVDEDDILLYSHADDEERFRTCKPLRIECHHCRVAWNFQGVFNIQQQHGMPMLPLSATFTQDGSPQPAPPGLKCPTSEAECKGLIANDSDEELIVTRLCNQLTLEMRSMIMQYYHGWLKCSDSSCGRRTRDCSVKNDACLAYKCTGTMTRQYSDADLYLQLQYYASLFDISRARDTLAAENKRRAEDPNNTLPQLSDTISAQHTRIYTRLHQHVQKVLSRSAYQWLDCSKIFAKMGIQK